MMIFILIMLCMTNPVLQLCTCFRTCFASCGSLGSLKEVIEQNMSLHEAPELFCFGLLEEFDLCQLVALVAPRPVRFINASERVQREMEVLNPCREPQGIKIQDFP